MLTLLKGCYPARLKKVLIVTAPLWFKAPFKVLRLFVREKLRDRVFTVSLPQLLLHVSAEALPVELGGLVDHDHELWLKNCETVTLHRDGELVTMSSSQPTTPSKLTWSSINDVTHESWGFESELQEPVPFRGCLQFGERYFGSAWSPTGLTIVWQVVSCQNQKLEN